MHLCRRCMAYLAGPEEIIDPDRLPNSSPPALNLIPGRCSCCGHPFGVEDDSQGRTVLEDCVVIQQPIPDLEETFTKKWARAGAKIGIVVSFLIAFWWMVDEGPGFGFLVLVAIGPCLVGFGILCCWAIATALTVLLNRPRMRLTLSDRSNHQPSVVAPKANADPENRLKVIPTQLEASESIQKPSSYDQSSVQRHQE